MTEFDYQVVTGDSRSHLEMLVQSRLNSRENTRACSWVCQGGISVVYFPIASELLFMQAMVRRRWTDDPPG